MINLKNSLKKVLAGAFGVVTMLTPFQSAQCEKELISIDIKRKNGFDGITLPDYEFWTIEDEVDKIDRNITDGVEACKKLILEPDNNEYNSKKVLNDIRSKLNNDELYYLIFGTTIDTLAYIAALHITYIVCTSEIMDKIEDIIKRLIDFIENTINKEHSSGTRYQMFFSKYKSYIPFQISIRTSEHSILNELSYTCHYCRQKNDSRFYPLVKKLLGLLTDIYEECGATEEVDTADSAKSRVEMLPILAARYMHG